MLAIFDWDGTVSDSTGKIVRCVQLAADELGFPALAPEAIKDIIGLSLPNAVAKLYPDLAPDGVALLAQTYSKHYVADDHVPGFYDGALEALETLHDERFTLAVATGKSRKGMERVFDQLGVRHLFAFSRCADETASKPDPLMLTQLLHLAQRCHTQAVMVGDTEFDMAMAKAIAMPRIAVSYGAHHISRLQNYQPALCVDDLRLLVPWFKQQREVVS
ncbi:MAG TPA: HAD-IA family hydrolase [Marinagarivorans sp.]